MTRGLTEKQEHILQFISEFTDDHGYPPSIRDIGDGFGISSLRGVTVHLDALERKGFIKRSNTARSITIVDKSHMRPTSRDVSFLPLLGTIAAGMPILATENVEQMVPVPQEIVNNIQGAFCLRVQGDSMINEHIMPRDLVVIKPQAHADNGDLVAVLIGEEATIKRIHFTDDKVRLIPANPAYDPIEINSEDSRIIGKVIGLLRNYHALMH